MTVAAISATEELVHQGPWLKGSHRGHRVLIV